MQKEAKLNMSRKDLVSQVQHNFFEKYFRRNIYKVIVLQAWWRGVLTRKYLRQGNISRIVYYEAPADPNDQYSDFRQDESLSYNYAARGI
jgi:hypothetical protein